MKHGKNLMMIGLVALFMITTINVCSAGPVVKQTATVVAGPIMGPVAEAPEAIPILLGTLNMYILEKPLTLNPGQQYTLGVTKKDPYTKNMGSTPAVGADIQLIDLKGDVLLKGTTDKNGAFPFVTPKEAGTYTFVASLAGYMTQKYSFTVGNTNAKEVNAITVSRPIISTSKPIKANVEEVEAISLGVLTISIDMKSVSHEKSFNAFVTKSTPPAKNMPTPAKGALVIVTDLNGAKILYSKAIVDEKGIACLQAPEKIGVYLVRATLEGYLRANALLFVS
jgi:hypothetical protein